MENTNQGELTIQENYVNQLQEADSLIDRLDEGGSEDHTDYTALDKEGILKHAETLLHSSDVRKAQDSLNRLRDALDTLLQAERPEQIKAWIEAGNDAKDFKPPVDEAKQGLQKIAARFRDKREEEKRRAEEEKLENYKKKKAVLEKIKALAESEESDNSLPQMRDLMREWKDIRHVPKEFQEELFATYSFYVDKFYDNLSKYNELKDLDKEKNLELKIELIKRTESLKGETNIRKVLISLNKFHEDWRNAGPVRKEVSEELWQRFKAVSDAVLAEIKVKQDEIDKSRQENLNLKQLLVEKAETAMASLPTTLKEWGNLGKELDSYLEEWKKIGPVPSQNNQEIWDKFSAARQQFFAARREYYQNLNSEKEENLNKKVALCEKAEQLKESTDFNATVDALNKLQEEWKKIGPVPEAKNDVVWKRFRAAFDHFYEKKNAWVKQRREEDKISVSVKEAIIEDMKKLLEETESDAVFGKLKECQSRWANSGFVSGKVYFNLQKTYKEIGDQLFAKFKRNSDEMKTGVMKDHYGTIAGSADGKFRLQQEERKIRDRIKKAQDELSTLENNKSFFAHSKNAEAVLKQFDSNIKKVNEQIERLQKELKVVKGLKDSNAQ
jgi:hypothetical protein